MGEGKGREREGEGRREGEGILIHYEIRDPPLDSATFRVDIPTQWRAHLAVVGDSWRHLRGVRMIRSKSAEKQRFRRKNLKDAVHENRTPACDVACKCVGSYGRLVQLACICMCCIAAWSRGCNKDGADEGRQSASVDGRRSGVDPARLDSRSFRRTHHLPRRFLRRSTIDLLYHFLRLSSSSSSSSSFYSFIKMWR